MDNYAIKLETDLHKQIRQNGPIVINLHITPLMTLINNIKTLFDCSEQATLSDLYLNWCNDYYNLKSNETINQKYLFYNQPTIESDTQSELSGNDIDYQYYSIMKTKNNNKYKFLCDYIVRLIAELDNHCTALYLFMNVKDSLISYPLCFLDILDFKNNIKEFITIDCSSLLLKTEHIIESCIGVKQLVATNNDINADDPYDVIEGVHKSVSNLLHLLYILNETYNRYVELWDL